MATNDHTLRAPSRLMSILGSIFAIALLATTLSVAALPPHVSAQVTGATGDGQFTVTEANGGPHVADTHPDGVNAQFSETNNGFPWFPIDATFPNNPISCEKPAAAGIIVTLPKGGSLPCGSAADGGGLSNNNGRADRVIVDGYAIIPDGATAISLQGANGPTIVAGAYWFYASPSDDRSNMVYLGGLGTGGGAPVATTFELPLPSTSSPCAASPAVAFRLYAYDMSSAYRANVQWRVTGGVADTGGAYANIPDTYIGSLASGGYDPGNYQDADFDDDGISDWIEMGETNEGASLDSDTDGIPDCEDTDSDNDGTLDTADPNRTTPTPNPDTTTVTEGGTVSFDVTANDTEFVSTNLSATDEGTGNAAGATISPGGIVSWDSTGAVAGEYTVDYELCNNDATPAGCGSGTLTITVEESIMPAAPDLQGGDDTGASATDDLTSKQNAKFSVACPNNNTVVRLFTDNPPGAIVGGYECTGTNTGAVIAGSSDAAGVTVSAGFENGLTAGVHNLTYTVDEGPVSAPLEVTIDLVGPAQPSAPDLQDGSDTGVSNADDLTSQTNPVFNVECVAAGSVVFLYSDVYTTPVGVLGDGAQSGSAVNNGSNVLVGFDETFTAPYSGNYTFVRRVESVPAGNGNLSIGTSALTNDVYHDGAASARLDSSNLERQNTVALTGGVEYFVYAWAGGGSTVTNPSYEFLLTTNAVGFHTCAGTGTEAATLGLVDLDEGVHNVSYTVTDAAGNESDPSAPLEITIDSAVPATPTIGSPTDGQSITSTTPTVEGTGGEPGSTVVVAGPNGEGCEATVAVDGTWSCTLSPALAQGANALTVTPVDPAGNEGTPAAITITVTAPAPSDPTVAPDLVEASDTGVSNSDDITANNTPVFAVECAGAGVDITLYSNNPEANTVIATHQCEGNGTESAPAPSAALEDGEHLVTYTAANADGAESGPSPALEVTIDSSAPDLTLTGPTDGGTLTTPHPTVTGTGAEPGTSIVVAGPNGEDCTVTVPASGNWACTLSPALPEGGPHTLNVTAVDPAGNTSSASVQTTIDTSGIECRSIYPPAEAVTLGANPPAVGAVGRMVNTSGANITGQVTAGAPLRVITDAAIQGPNGSLLPVEITIEHKGGSQAFRYTLGTTGHLSNSSGTSWAEITVKFVGYAENIPTVWSVNAGSIGGGERLFFNSNPVTGFVRGAGGQNIANALPYNGTWSNGNSNPLSGFSFDYSTSLTFRKLGQQNVSSGIPISALLVPEVRPCAAIPDLVSTSDTGPSDEDDVTSERVATFEVECIVAGSTITLRSDNPAAGTVVGSHTCTAAGTEPLTVDAPGLAEGVHNLSYVETNAGGLDSTPSPSLEVTVDLTEPATPTITGPTDGELLTTATPTVEGTDGEPGSTVVVTGPNGETCDALVDTDGNWSCEISPGLPEGGPQTITATPVDPAGNEGTPTTININVDTVEPGTPTITGPTDGELLTTATPTVEGTDGEPGSAVVVTGPNDETCTAPVDADGNWSCDIAPGLPEGGPQIVTATPVDPAGNEGTPTTININVDTVEPPTPTITGPTDGEPINSGTPEVTGTGGEPGSTVVVTGSNGETCDALVDTDGNWSCDIAPGLIEGGPHTITATPVDLAGNEGTPATVAVNVDTVVPPTPTVSGPGEGETITTATPTIEGTGGEPGTTVVITGPNGETCDAPVDADGNWSCAIAPALPEGGPHTITATPVDPAGNEGTPTTVEVEVDTIAPETVDVAPSLESASDTGESDADELTSIVTPEVEVFCAEPGLDVTLHSDNPADGTVIGTHACEGAGTELVTVDEPGLAEGIHNLSYTLSDDNGNVSGLSPEVEVTIDLTGPEAPTPEELTNGSNNETGTPEISGTSSEPGSTVIVTGPNGETCKAPVDEGGNWSCEIAPALPAGGPHEITLTPVDPAGNVGTPASFEVSTNPDTDGDGVSDLDEADHRGGDGNGDGVDDSSQASVTSTPNLDDDDFHTIESSGDDCSQVSEFTIAPESPTSSDGGYDYPLGLFDFTVECDEVGARANITIYLDEQYNTSDWVWRKYDSATGEYSLMSGVTFGTAVVDGQTVTTATLSLVDGGSADEDGTANASIVDPSGPGVLSQAQEAAPVLALTGRTMFTTTLLSFVMILFGVSLVLLRGRREEELSES